MIPFCKTDLGKEEIEAVSKVIEGGWVVQGAKTQEFEEMFAEYVGSKYAVFVDSCTSALFLALKAAFGDKADLTISVPSLTFVATAEAIVHAGHIPKFVDVDTKDLCMLKDRVDVLSLPVNLLGNRAPDGAVVYDSAHRIERGDMHDREAIYCYSFYATKNMTTVQGGMIATNSQKVYEWLKQARDHGLNLGTKERYTEKYKQYDVDFIGWRNKADDFRAVVGIEQLKKLPELNEKRASLVNRYNDAFGYQHTGNHLYPIFVKDRDRVTEFLYNQGIQTAVHFRPLHTMTAYKNFPKSDLTNTEIIGGMIVSLPLYPRLTVDEQDYIIENVKSATRLEFL